WPRGLTTSARERSRRWARIRHTVFHRRYRLEVRENRCQISIGEIFVHRDGHRREDFAPTAQMPAGANRLAEVAHSLFAETGFAIRGEIRGEAHTRVGERVQ